MEYFHEINPHQLLGWHQASSAPHPALPIEAASSRFSNIGPVSQPQGHDTLIVIGQPNLQANIHGPISIPLMDNTDVLTLLIPRPTSRKLKCLLLNTAIITVSMTTFSALAKTLTSTKPNQPHQQTEQDKDNPLPAHLLTTNIKSGSNKHNKKTTSRRQPWHATYEQKLIHNKFHS